MPILDLPHLAGLIFGTPLMIARPKLETIVGVLQSRLVGGLDPGPTDPRPVLVTPDGIAVIPLVGTLVNRTFGISALSGLSSYQGLSADLAAAVADPQVRGILLEVDSPGGEAGGVFDLADQVAAARSVKPVFAVASEACFSAAYAIASGAERLFVTQTGGVGSIGVVALHVDRSGADAAEGLHYDYIVAGDRKTDGNPHQPLTDGARAALQAEVDRLYGLFVGLVARNRGLTDAAIRDQQAALYFGPNAIAAGLADQVGSFDTALAALRVRPNPAIPRSGSPGSARIRTGGTMSDTPTAAVDPVANPEATLREQIATELGAPVSARPPADLEARLRAEATEIVELCQIAGRPELAVGFIRQGLTPAAVRKTLLDGAAAAYEATATRPVETATPQGDNPLIAAIKAAYPRKG